MSNLKNLVREIIHEEHDLEEMVISSRSETKKILDHKGRG